MKRTMHGLLVLALLAGPMSAHAYLVTVDAKTYDVTTVVGTFLELQSSLTNQPWWGNENKAKEFATQLGAGFGLPNNNGLEGPLFAYQCIEPCDDGTLTPPLQIARYISLGGGAFGISITKTSAAREFTFAKANEVPLPPALYLLGLGFASLLGLGTRRRQESTPV